MFDSSWPHGLQHARPPVHHQLPELTQIHVHWVSDAIQPSHPLSSPYPPTFNLSQHQGLFKWVSSSHRVAKLLEFQLQYQSFQWIFRTDLLQDGLVGSPCCCCPRDSQECSPTPQFKSTGPSEKIWWLKWKQEKPSSPQYTKSNHSIFFFFPTFTSHPININILCGCTIHPLLQILCRWSHLLLEYQYHLSQGLQTQILSWVPDPKLWVGYCCWLESTVTQCQCLLADGCYPIHWFVSNFHCQCPYYGGG